MTHQHNCLYEIAEFFAGSFNETKKPHALAVLPTGTGKSLIALLSPYMVGARKVLIITPSKVITNQLDDDATGGSGNQESVYVRRGIVTTVEAEDFVPSTITQHNSKLAKLRQADIVFANAQKFTRTAKSIVDDGLGDFALNPEFFPPGSIDMVIVDEAHHYPATTWRRIIDYYQDSKCLFLTATPYRMANNPDLVAKFEEVYRFARESAVQAGVIRNLDWRQSDTVIHSLAQILTEERPATLAMALAASKEDCDKAVKQLADLNITAASYYGNEREKSKRRFVKEGQTELQVLVVCGKLLEGFDCPRVSVCAFLYATGSFLRFNQFAGRCVRIDRSAQQQQSGIVVGPSGLGDYAVRLQREEDANLPDEDPEDDLEDE